MRRLGLAGALAALVAAPAAAMTAPQCRADLDAALAVFPVTSDDVALATTPADDGWCQIAKAVEPLKGLEWQSARTPTGFRLALRRFGLSAGKLGPMDFALIATYNDAAQELTIRPAQLSRDATNGLAMQARIGQIDLGSPADARQSLETMALQNAEIVVGGQAPFVSAVAALAFGQDANAARNDPQAAAAQRTEMLTWFRTVPPEGAVDADSAAHFTAFTRAYPASDGAAIVLLAADPALRLGPLYRFLIQPEVPQDGAGVLDGLMTAFRWHPAG